MRATRDAKLSKIYGNQDNIDVMVDKSRRFTWEQLDTLTSATEKIYAKLSDLRRGTGALPAPAAGGGGGRGRSSTISNEAAPSEFLGPEGLVAKGLVIGSF